MSETRPRILYLDIETTPSLVYTWGLFDQNVGLSQVVKPTSMMAFAARWHGDPKNKVHFYSGLKDDNKTWHNKFVAMVKAAHAMLDEADVVVHYNGRSFDEKHLNREFLELGLTPPSPFQSIDLFQTVKTRFKFLSSKLDHVTKQLGLEGKVGHEGFSLWTRCMARDPKAWATMETYNRRDVTLLEDLYVELRPWIKGHPNVLHDHPGGGCPRCGSDEKVKRGRHRTAASEFQTYQCKGCGGYYRDRRAHRPATGSRPV